MTEGSRPPVGTRCAPCNRAAHLCWAATYSDGDLYPAGVPLCAYCADGESCGKGGASKATPPQALNGAAASPPEPKPELQPAQRTGLDDGPLLPARRHFGKGIAATTAAGRLAEEGYKVISLAEMPGRKHAGVYDDIVAEFMKLPKLSVLTKTFNSREIANTYMLAIVRIGRKRGLKMRQKQDGNTIYVWQE